MNRCELPEGLWQVCRWEEDEYYAHREWESCPDCYDIDRFPEAESWIDYEAAEIGFSCEDCGIRVVDCSEEDEEC